MTDSSEQDLEKAFDWMLALRERPNDAALREAHRAWLAESPAHARAFARAQTVWAAAGDAAPARPRTARRRSAWLALAAAAAIALMIALPDLWLRGRADHATGTGEVRQVVLDDGSKVVLDADSAIAVRYSARRREVLLLRGDALFTAARDPARPFSVHSGTVTATALGTAFAVQSDADAVVVAVASGTVQVAGGGPPLQPGDRVTVDLATGTARRSTMPVDEIGGWRNGRLFMENAPLRRVVAALDRYHTGRIVIAGRTLADKRVTGVWDPRDTEDALKAAVAPLGGTVRRITPFLLVVSDF